ncbi:sulfotransferase family protein [Actibacterium pelagium]|uniref:Sulfotransferase family protein n=1 Tax=Actibacterium pelagium TaxID=2029103 RepID=A0A917AEL2_9RHOB|nr:sulfotransferase family protein [Actibacterium pelagium]GGE46050.1 hypothetical protein GCM10011517_12160 [Actibacterium pelagium]
MDELKVINLGLPKSGTTTLAEALRQAGLLVADWRIRKGEGSKARLQSHFVGKLMYKAYFNTGNPLARLGDFDAFTEISVVRDGLCLWPQTDLGLITAIEEFHPGVKFLLSYRDSVALSDSMERWSDLGSDRLPDNPIPGLPVGFGHRHPHRLRWIEGHYEFCRRVFAGRDNFLEYDIEDPEAPTKIGAFLGRDLPWWGVENFNEYRTSDTDIEGEDAF